MRTVLVQFELQRVACGNSSQRLRTAKSKPEVLPFAIWVEWPSVRLCLHCGSPSYSATEESVIETETKFGLDHTDSRRYVCESVGRIIE